MYIPIIEEKNDVWLPLDKTVYEIITLISKSIDNIGETPFLYNRYTGICYDVLRLVYGYTSTSAQHIAKFRHDYHTPEYMWGAPHWIAR